MEDLLTTQNQLMSAINQLLVNFKKDGADRKTPSHVKRRLETLDGYWQTFQLNHNKLISEKDYQSHAYFLENCYERTSVFYKEAREFISKYLECKKEDKPLLKPATPLSKPASPAHQTTMFEFPSVSGSSCPPSSGVSNKLDEMLRHQKSNFKAFSRTISLNYSEMTENYELEDFLQTLNLRWSAIDSHWKIDSEMLEENEEYEQTFSRYEQKYIEIKKEVTIKISSASHRERSTPKTEVPSFSGDYNKWITFKDLFIEAIHNNGSMSNCQKMQFLKAKLRGEAEQIVSHLRVTADNYQVCWDILNNRFNNVKFIFDSYMGIIMKLPTLQHQSTSQLKKMHDSVVESLNSIKNLGIDISSWDPMVVYILERKLDPETSKDYCQSLKNPRALPSIKDFTDFLESKFTSLEATQRTPNKHTSTLKTFIPVQQHQKNHKFNFINKPKQINNIVHKNAQTGCKLCKKEHGIFNCTEFLKLSPQQRRSTIAKLKICVNCLYDHFGKKCLSEKRCRECNGCHNTLVHEAFLELPINNESQPQNVSHVSRNDISETLLETALVNVRSADGTLVKLRALIDQGSQTSLISEHAAQILKLPRQRCKSVIFGVGSKQNNCKGILKIVCSSTYSDYQFDTEVFIMTHLVNNLPNHTFTKPAWSFLEGIQLADPDFNVKRPVDLLFGADIYSSIIMSGIISSDKSLPVVQQTRLGWVLCGNVKSFQCNVIVNNIEEIQRFWEIEDIPDDSSLSQDDAKCLEFFKNTTTRQPDGRYVVRLPLISDAKEQLGESKSKAVAQLKQLEKKFSRNPDLEKDYKTFINDYINLNHMQPTPCNTKPIVYLPHHCVIKDSLSTALRVVFNGSSKTTSGRSLNDVMYRGPNLQQDLLSLIIKWRQYKYAYTADIEKMFRNIALHIDDQCMQTIMWRDSTSQPMQEYSLTTVTYGTKAAPFLAMMVLKQLASDEGHKYQSSPAAKVLNEHFYMDDLIHGNHDIQSAKQLQTDLIKLLQAGGFNLRKWSANTKELLQNINTATTNEQTYDFKDDVSTKILGLRWHPQTDIFTFDLKINLSENIKYTKRSLLSEISKLFDPLGWLTPVSMKFKLLFQRIWFKNIEWDDALPADISDEWLNIKIDLKNITKIEIPRWLQICENEVIQLHGFCDSSNNAYACVIYCNIKRKYHNHNLKDSVMLVASKSRLVPPKKNITLPRLELSAALLLSKLMQKVISCFTGYNIEMFGWSDSTAVLGWLQGDPGRWKTFVANRVIQITRILPSESWRYVKSSENPADCASRGISMEQLNRHPLWWHGPAWLVDYEANQATQKSYITTEEVKKAKISNVTILQSNQDDVISNLINRNSCWRRATRILAYVLRFKQNCKLAFLTAAEVKQARFKIIEYIQNIEFYKDFTHLQNHKQVPSRSKLLCFNPYLDQDGLLRVGGRLKNANISKEMMHPLIIPHNSHLTNLLIDHAHLLTFHGGAQLTLAKLRQQYWIIGDRQKSLKAIGQQIEEMKAERSEIEQISFHNVHHYVAIYILATCLFIAIIVFLWRRRQETCTWWPEPRSAGNSVAPAPAPESVHAHSAIPALQPDPPELSQSLGVCVSDNPCASVSNNPSKVPKVFSEKPRVVSVVYKNKKVQMVDRKETIFPTFNELS